MASFSGSMSADSADQDEEITVLQEILNAASASDFTNVIDDVDRIEGDEDDLETGRASLPFVSRKDESTDNKWMVTMRIAVDLPDADNEGENCHKANDRIRVLFNCPSPGAATNLEDSFRVRHLPPIRLQIVLPADYPSNSPPDFKVICVWMTHSQIESLRSKLLSLWEELKGCVILYNWYNFLKEEALSTLGIDKDLDISAVIQNAIIRRMAKEARARADLAKQEAASRPPIDRNLVLIDDDGDDLDHRRQASATASAISTPSSASSSVGVRQRRLAQEKEQREFDRLNRQAKKKESRQRQRHAQKDSPIVCNAEEYWDGKCSEGSVVSEKKVDIRVVQPGEERERLQKRLALAKEANRRVKERNERSDSPKVKVSGEGGESKRIPGFVTKWVEEHGFGFIEDRSQVGARIKGGPRGKPRDMYFQRKDLVNADTVDIGDVVTFEASLVSHNKAISIKIQMGDPNDSLDEDSLEALVVGASSDDHKKKPPRTCKRQPRPPDEMGRSEPERLPAESAASSASASPLANAKLDPTYKVLVDFQGNIVTPTVSQAPAAAAVCDVPSVYEKAETRVPVPEVVAFIKEFDAREKLKEFSRSIFPCLVCFQEKSGSKCLQFQECSHIYCKSCMTTYFATKIRDGCSTSIKCPETGCETMAHQTQVRKLVSQDLYQLYESKVLETLLDEMTDVLLCPRRACQCPTVIDRSMSMGQCPKCAMAFCIYCKSAYHGLDPCKIQSKEHQKLITEYMEGDAASRLQLEKRYGKRQLTTMANEFRSEVFKSENTKRCPNCTAPIEKSEGCNKMTCNKCGTYFCYLCGDRLPKENPYSHFNLLGGGCFNRLFEGADEEDAEFVDLLDELGGEELEAMDDEEFVRRLLIADGQFRV